jgi:hypothetical protein
LAGCTFCGLYRNSPDHRRMPVQKALRQIADAIQRYHVLDLALVDAYLPRNYRDEFLDGLLNLCLDISIFTEMRCDVTRDTAKRLSRCARRIQFGVESFTNAILCRIGKGVRAAEVVYSLRVCQDLGIDLQYNLMTRIPGVSIPEIEDLSSILSVLFGLVPPNIAAFYLDRNSIIFKRAREFGIEEATLDTERPAWLAHSLGDSRICQVVPFKTRDQEADQAWDRVEARTAQWRERFRWARSNGLRSPLTWRDGGKWASVIDARRGAPTFYVLEGVLYDLFLASCEVNSDKALRDACHRHEDRAITDGLEELVRCGILFYDGLHYVSLPVRCGTQAACAS